MSPALLTHSASVQRPTTTADSYGGHSKAWATVYGSLPGSLQPAKGRTIEEFARRSMQVTNTFYTTQAVSLLAGDRLVCGGVNYLVVAFADMAGRGSHYAIHLLRKD